MNRHNNREQRLRKKTKRVYNKLKTWYWDLVAWYQRLQQLEHTTPEAPYLVAVPEEMDHSLLI